jgi:hypothetical protein
MGGRFRRKWALEQRKYYRGNLSPATPAGSSGTLDEVAAALVGWMDEVDIAGPLQHAMAVVAI